MESHDVCTYLTSTFEGYYPRLMKLYRKLGVSIRKANFTFSFSTYSHLDMPFFLYNGQSGLRGISLPSQTSIRTFLTQLQLLIVFIASYFALLIFALYHSIFGHLQDPDHSLSSEPLSPWLARHTTSIKPIFVESLLIPLFSAMTTSSTGQVFNLPTAEVLLYISSTFLQSHYTVTHGVGEAQTRLITHIPRENLHLATPIHEVVAMKRTDAGDSDDARATTSLLSLDAKTKKPTQYDGFHHIIFATPANLSASLLQTYRKSLSSLSSRDDLVKEIDRLHSLQNQLEQVQYATSTVINHTDISILPRNQKDWRDLNLIAPPSHSPTKAVQSITSKTTKKAGTKEQDYTMATHLCHYSVKSDKFVFQTTNPLVTPKPESILSSSTFSRALTSSKSQLQGLFVWKRRKSSRLHDIGEKWEMHLGHLHRKDKDDDLFSNLWFCGSYSQGIPLLEGCITSSSLVVAAIQEQEA
jgi:predicted NAD/FAD-binding protein